ncbi:MAG: hypothetical protein LBU38_08210 [Propionibacteriaceae bacterium]|jgi:hypothetical protein|nr:hypothetical protein [Propionibacteriaceae bacterium]
MTFFAALTVAAVAAVSSVFAQTIRKLRVGRIEKRAKMELAAQICLGMLLVASLVGIASPVVYGLALAAVGIGVWAGLAREIS